MSSTSPTSVPVTVLEKSESDASIVNDIAFQIENLAIASKWPIDGTVAACLAISILNLRPDLAGEPLQDAIFETSQFVCMLPAPAVVEGSVEEAKSDA